MIIGFLFSAFMYIVAGIIGYIFGDYRWGIAFMILFPGYLAFMWWYSSNKEKWKDKKDRLNHTGDYSPEEIARRKRKDEIIARIGVLENKFKYLEREDTEFEYHDLKDELRALGFQENSYEEGGALDLKKRNEWTKEERKWSEIYFSKENEERRNRIRKFCEEYEVQKKLAKQEFDDEFELKTKKSSLLQKYSLNDYYVEKEKIDNKLEEYAFLRGIAKVRKDELYDKIIIIKDEIKNSYDKKKIVITGVNGYVPDEIIRLRYAKLQKETMQKYTDLLKEYPNIQKRSDMIKKIEEALINGEEFGTETDIKNLWEGKTKIEIIDLSDRLKVEAHKIDLRIKELEETMKLSQQ